MDRAKESATEPAEDVEPKTGRRNFRAKARPGGRSGKGAVREKKRVHARRA